MSDTPIVSVADISKAYQIYAKPSDLFREAIFGGKRHDLFWALRNISFSIREKQRLGIIGPNGAGKSTLLQIITGNLQPTSGSVHVAGKISALLSMNPGWNNEESGIENIRFNLLLQGCKPESIPRLTEDIVDFTELGHFIYRPVKTYSTGMSARLSFAIATAISPEVLIIDEVLGVGDGYFSGKANQRMKEMCDRGKALILVSHSLSAIRSICDTAIWLENGEIRMSGTVDHVATKYEEDTLRSDEETRREGNMRRIRETMHLVAPEDVSEQSLCRVRIREANEPRVLHTHYIRGLKVVSQGSELSDVPIEHRDIRQTSVQAVLDLSGCEWSRLYSRGGTECRILSPRTGARKGGHILLKRPPELNAEVWHVVLEIEVAETESSHLLCADFLNLRDVTWDMMTVVDRSRSRDGWSILRLSADIPPCLPGTESKVIEKATQQLLQPVQILDTAIIVGGAPTNVIREMQPFKLRIRLRQHESVPATSVNINISRADGVYTFYQPSGLNGQNIENFIGDAVVEFDFQHNPLGAGEYEVNVFACNGWSWDNIPPSEIFDRSIGVFRFTILQGNPIPFGIVNMRVPVTIHLEPLDAHAETKPSLGMHTR